MSSHYPRQRTSVRHRRQAVPGPHRRDHIGCGHCGGQHTVHRHPDLWENPNTFDPTRFGPDREAPNRFAYLPFSRGQRQCIGDRFAEMESVLVVATLFQRYRFALVPGQDLTPEASVTLRPANGLKMILEARP